MIDFLVGKEGLKVKKSILILIISCCFAFSLTAFTKDEIVDHYNQALQEIRDDSLTPKRKLKGQRSFGIDSYVGSYSADYEV